MTAQSDYGGGIEILGPARADIGSPGAVFRRYGIEQLGAVWRRNCDTWQ